jgi:hypothetical protein
MVAVSNSSAVADERISVGVIGIRERIPEQIPS